MLYLTELNICMNLWHLNILKPEGKKPLERPGHVWEDNIKIDFKEMECEGKTALHKLWLGSSSRFL